MTDKEKIVQYLKVKKISKNKFYKKTGFSVGFLDSGSSLGVDKLRIIIDNYPDFNSSWLLTGKGEMLITGEKNINDLVNEEPSLDSVPFWNLQVSAGHSVADIVGQKKPDGYINGLPGADIAENIFPVAGASMEPEVSNGAIIGVRQIDNWESLNTERIYMIITKEDRMIKRIEYDVENENILWCVSPNYPKFKIFKDDIIEIQRVCFVYNPK